VKIACRVIELRTNAEIKDIIVNNGACQVRDLGAKASNPSVHFVKDSRLL